MSRGSECRFFLALDPGREKVGVAVLGEDGSVAFRGVFPLEGVQEVLWKLRTEYAFDTAVLGGSTGSTLVLPLLEGLGVLVHRVDERGSSEEARRLYLEECFGRGWKRLLAFFISLCSSRSLDDWQAVVIGRRFLKGCGKSHERGRTLP
jgi:RNase H-fold protein (predicted Holliday junction resolvase)|uniref:YqgF/RNase H-like domain-containing protein n=1 Tax=Candidatus Caldatribacterium californiense TaxID=1454726 RepID=A0A7V4DDA8_9BACT